MADLRYILDPSLELQAAKPRVQDGSAARRAVMLLSWKRNAMSDKAEFMLLPCAKSFSSLGITARQLSLNCIISSVRAVIYAAAITQGTIVMKHGV